MVQNRCLYSFRNRSGHISKVRSINSNFKSFNVIQRPQTAYLFIAALINLSVFFTPVYSTAIQDPSAWIGYGITIGLIIASVAALCAIFLFKNRKLQHRITKIALYGEAAVMGIAAGMLVTSGGLGRHLLGDIFGSLLIAVSLILLWLAARQIKKDEELVQSMDRIR